MININRAVAPFQVVVVFLLFLTSCGGGGPDGEVQAGGGAPIAGESTSTCANALERCVDVTSARIAVYKDNKHAAASYTFDDGLQSSVDIAAMFESIGLPVSFYINPGLVKDWEVWRALSRRGHEIGNHSMTHVNFSEADIDLATIRREIGGAQSLIEQQIGVRPLIFAFPGHLYESRALAVALESHIATRVTGLDDKYKFAAFDQTNTLENANALLTTAVESGGWYVAVGHGIDGDGWSPVSADFLKSHLSLLEKHRSKLWIDTYQNVMQYRECRDRALVTTTSLPHGRIDLRVIANFNSFCSSPLTVLLDFRDEEGKGRIRVLTESGVSIPISFEGSSMRFNVTPGESVTISM